VTVDPIARLVQLAMGYALAVRPGDVLVISGPRVAEPLVYRLFGAALGLGALPVIRYRGDLYRETTLCTAGDGAERWVNPLGVPEGRPVARSVGIWAMEEAGPAAHALLGECAPAGAAGPSAPALRSHPEEHARQREFLQAAAAGKLRWLALFYPTPAAARIAGMAPDAFEQLIFAADMLDELNPPAAWRALFERQERLCQRLGRARTIRFTTPRGTDLTMRIGGRKWINSGGHRNLPDGEVFTAPVEGSVTGVFSGDLPVLHEDQVIDGVRLEFDGGRLVRAFAERGDDALQRLIAQDPGAARVGEVAIGLNPRLAVGTKMSLLDEKIGGTFHIALGAAYPETGGSNDSLVHRDFVADLRQGGRIELDGRVFSEDGALV